MARLIAAVPTGTTAKRLADFAFELLEADSTLNDFARSPFIHAKSAASDIRNGMMLLWRAAETGDTNQDGSPTLDFNREIEAWRATSLVTALREMEMLLARESPTLPFFFLPQKGLARTEQLVNNAELDFAPSVRDVLAEFPRALDEIRQAGKALAFDLFTARAFHIMRTVEILVLELLDTHGAKPQKEAQQNLGNYVKILKEKGADSELTRFLDEMVRVERNESIHPTRLFDEAQADMIYSIAKSAITATVAELAKGSVELPNATEQPQLEFNGLSEK